MTSGRGDLRPPASSVQLSPDGVSCETRVEKPQQHQDGLEPTIRRRSYDRKVSANLPSPRPLEPLVSSTFIPWISGDIPCLVIDEVQAPRSFSRVRLS